MDLLLKSRVAVITGGVSGIGLACVKALLAEGARALIVDRDIAGIVVAHQLSEQGHTVAFIQADITDETQVQRAMKYAQDAFGGIDTLIGCAGISGPVGKKAEDVTAEEWDRVMAVNVKGHFLVAKHSIPLLKQSKVATIVLIASDSALVAFEGMTPYCTSKGAALMLTKGLSVDYPELRVNCLCPGVVDTPMSRTDLGRPDGFAGTNLPVMQASQLAQHAAFLASPISSPINGTSIVADFGYLARSALPPLEFE